MIFRSFRSQVTLVFGGLVFFLSTGLSIVLATLVYEGMAAEQARTLGGIAAYAGATIAEGLRERLREIEMLAASTETAPSDAAANRHRLERLQRSEPAYAWIGITDARGIVGVEGEPLFAGRPLADRAGFAASRRGPRVGDPHADEALARNVRPEADGAVPTFLDFAAPLFSPAGDFAGVVSAEIHWRWIVDLIERVPLQQLDEQDFVFFLVDRNGLPLHRSRRSATAEPLPQAVPRPASAGVVVWPDGRRYLTAVAAVRGRSTAIDLGWRVVARLPESRALSAAVRARWVILAGGAFVGALAAALAWLLAAAFSQPLGQISAAAGRLEAGELGEQIPRVGGSREIRGLSRALRSMKRRLQVGQRAVQRAYSTVESRVRERTAGLTAENSALEKLAQRDALTGLHNRRAADSRLAEEIARHRRNRRPLGVLLLDIDHFKNVNDLHGHAVGDQALRAVADCLRSQLRASDFVARFGGEEFLLLLPETGSALALHAGEKLRAAIAAMLLPTIGRLTVSIGAAELPPDVSLDAAQLVHAADLALYEAKTSGRNRVVAFDALLQPKGAVPEAGS